MSNHLRKLKKRFVETMIEVAENSEKPIMKTTRNEYIRYTVDNDVEDRLNKVELNLLGGFKEAKHNYIAKISSSIDIPKILIFDIETSPLEVYAWSLWDQFTALNQVIKDWEILSFASKWLGEDESKIVYHDKRNDDTDERVVRELHAKLDEADILITQNGISFDVKKANARFMHYGLQPPSSSRHFDTLRVAKSKFKFTSNKLEYMTKKFCTKYTKLDHGKFGGFSLWKECLAGNEEAWEEMELYNRYDVLSLEELAIKLLPWDTSINFDVYNDCEINVCTCGSIDFKKAGFYTTNACKYQKYKCKQCGKEKRDKKNLLSKSKKKSLRK